MSITVFPWQERSVSHSNNTHLIECDARYSTCQQAGYSLPLLATLLLGIYNVPCIINDSELRIHSLEHLSARNRIAGSLHSWYTLGFCRVRAGIGVAKYHTGSASISLRLMPVRRAAAKVDILGLVLEARDGGDQAYVESTLLPSSSFL